jgi:hypothetical protein
VHRRAAGDEGLLEQAGRERSVLRADADGRVWFHTGDIARMDEDGYTSIVQRKKDMIIVDGFNVYPSEVEGVLTMGGGIAAHFANAGIPAYLLDVSQQIVKASLDRLKKNTPAAFVTPETAELVTIGALDDHEAWIGEGDWIIEAIVESSTEARARARIDRLRKPGSIVSSNTSGASDRSDRRAQRRTISRRTFSARTFFNPPRYMKLLEVIPTPDTKPEVTSFVREFAERAWARRRALQGHAELHRQPPRFDGRRVARRLRARARLHVEETDSSPARSSADRRPPRSACRISSARRLQRSCRQSLWRDPER